MAYDYHKLPDAAKPLSGDEYIGISQLRAPKRIKISDLTGSAGITNIDGGGPAAVYLTTQNIECGDPDSNYLPSQIFDEEPI